jgi:ABC transporter substrate binding protein
MVSISSPAAHHLAGHFLTKSRVSSIVLQTAKRPASHASTRCSRNRRSIGLRTRASAARKCSRAVLRLPRRNSSSPSALAAARNNVSTVYTLSAFATDGGLLSYGVDPVDTFRRAAAYVDRILRGAKPSQLPVQFPTKFELVINLKTAKALGLPIPPSILALTDGVIDKTPGVHCGAWRRGGVAAGGAGVAAGRAGGRISPNYFARD